MPVEIWIAFVAASAVMLVIPGPTVLLVSGLAMSHGARRAWPCAVGVALGDATALVCSLLGLGAFLQASAHVFTLLKLAGAAYLVWMGVQMILPQGTARAGSDEQSQAVPRGANVSDLMLKAYVVTALNPKAILFFVAFVPQFVVPGPDAVLQMAVILATFVTLSLANALAFILLAGFARRTACGATASRLSRRFGGLTLVGAGLWTAAREA
jgi:threonine/homoserine/homoserine lactone efflux protein